MRNPQSSWRVSKDYSPAIQELLMQHGLIFELVSDERLPKDSEGLDHHLIMVKAGKKFIAIEPYIIQQLVDFQKFTNRARRALHETDLYQLDEYWGLSGGSLGKLELPDNIKMLTAQELQNLVAIYADRPKRKPRATRKPKATAQAVKANAEEVVLSSHALEQLISEKISGLRRERRPNSNEGREALDEEVAQYEDLKKKLVGMRKSVVAYTKSSTNENELDQSVKTFEQGVQAWWIKYHEKICDRSFDTALFISAVTVLSLCGVATTAAAAISGVLIGGKPFAEAMKALVKFWK